MGGRQAGPTTASKRYSSAAFDKLSRNVNRVGPERGPASRGQLDASANPRFIDFDGLEVRAPATCHRVIDDQLIRSKLVLN